MKYIVSLSLILTMVVIPYSVNGDAPLYISVIALISVIGICLRLPGAEFLLTAIALCLPSGWVGTSGLVFPEIDVMKSAFGRFMCYVVPFIGAFLLLSDFPQKRNLKILILGFLWAGVVSSLLTYDLNELRRMLSLIGCCYAFMFICYNDVKIKMKNAFFYFDILFFISLIYGISEFIFRESPYQYITDATTDLMDIGRARGILGHPLYLSGLALTYQSVIFLKYLLSKKFGYFQEVMCIIIALIVVSRTTIVIMFLEYILFVILSQGYKNVKFLIGNLIIIIGGAFAIFMYADSLVFDIIARFTEGNVDHRQGAFETVFLLLLDNPFGVGSANIMDKIAKGGYGAIGFSSSFSTVDNLFLSQIAAYGIFSVFTISFYFFFLYDAYKKRKKFPMLFRSILILYFPFVLESFSFDWDGSVFLCMLLFGFVGFVYRWCKSQDSYIYFSKLSQVNNYSSRCV